jgi:LysR family hydrogen peroxide-inducible transcriptional activator
MTLTELKYIVALAREKHFGRAAESCFVSQPTLSVAIKKLEDELNVLLFERGPTEVSLTAVGDLVVSQAQRVLEEAAAIKVIAQQGMDPLVGTLRVGVIYTIGPYLLPELVSRMIKEVPSMPLVLQENFTVRLLELLKQGEIDVAVLALPINESGFVVQPLYEEQFMVAVPRTHEWAGRTSISGSELKLENMLLLGAGHCFRDEVLGICPELSRFSHSSEGIQRTFEGSSLETIRHMVASGVGVTVLPSSSVPNPVPQDSLLAYVPLADQETGRTVVLVWRKSFARFQALDVLRKNILVCSLNGVRFIDSPGKVK